MSASNEQFTFGNRIGLFILVEISAISASAVTILLTYIAVGFPHSSLLWPQMLTCLLPDSTAQLVSAQAQGVDGE
jgi:hypothetical protein